MAGSSFLSRAWVCSLLAGVGAIAVFATPTDAQLVEDTTPGRSLGTQVVPSVDPRIDLILNGTQQGQNLFHSFQQFNVQAGRGVYFENLPGVRNIFNRITGGNPSNIDGAIGVLGTANLFLINPSGIVFGQTAVLDVQGSFVATTANAIRFGDLGFFSASNPEPPTLLTIDPSAYLFNSQQIQPIVTRAAGGIISLTGQQRVGLQVPDGKNITLLGGDIVAERSAILAFGGRVELGGLSSPGIVEIVGANDNAVLKFSEQTPRANVSLAQSLVSVQSGAAGSINIHAKDFKLLQGSRLFAGINTTLLGVNNQAGDITVNAQGDIKLDSGVIVNFVAPNTNGNAGGITISGHSLSMTDASLSSFTQGVGNAGNISIYIDNAIESTRSSFISSTVGAGGVGNSGTIDIKASQLTLEGGAQIQTRVQEAENNLLAGQGEAGKVSIQVSGALTLIGLANNQASSISTILSRGTVGTAGDIQIQAGSISLLNGANLNAASYGQGKAGNIFLNADQAITIEGEGIINLPNGTRGLLPSGIATFTADLLPTRTIGDAGNIEINAHSIYIGKGGFITTNTERQGNAGRINIHVGDSLTLSGVGSTQSSLIASGVGRQGKGGGGEIDIRTRDLSILNGAGITSATQGEGDSGLIQITANGVVTLRGVGFINNQEISSRIFSIVENGATGNAQSIIIDAKELQLLDRGQLNAETRGVGSAGNIFVRNANSVFLSNSLISTSFASNSIVGKAGNIDIQTNNLVVQDNSQIKTDSVSATANAGDINVLARDRIILREGQIITGSSLSSGGAITLSAKSIRLFGNSNIVTSVLSGQGSGGTITLDADTILAFNDSDILAFARDGQGGNITLNTRAFFGQNYRPAPPGTDPLTLNGNDRVDVNASGAVSGVITIPDTTFIQNSLTQLAQNLIDPNTLLANSCIVRNRQQNGSFFVTGSGGLPVRPGDAPPASFPTGEVRSLSNTQSQNNRPWQPGDPIVEPQGIYRLPNGKLVMSRECQTQ